MNQTISGIKKDLVPRVIVNGNAMYIAFVHKTSKKPYMFYDFLQNNGSSISESAKRIDGDYVYKLSPLTYFMLNDKLMRGKTTYNLRKKMHEYDKTKKIWQDTNQK